MSHAPNNSPAPSVEPSPDQQRQPRALALAAGSAYRGHGDAEKMLFGGTLADVEAEELEPWLSRPNAGDVARPDSNLKSKG